MKQTLDCLLSKDSSMCVVSGVSISNVSNKEYKNEKKDLSVLRWNWSIGDSFGMVCLYLWSWVANDPFISSSQRK